MSFLNAAGGTERDERRKGGREEERDEGRGGRPQFRTDMHILSALRTNRASGSSGTVTPLRGTSAEDAPHAFDFPGNGRERDEVIDCCSLDPTQAHILDRNNHLFARERNVRMFSVRCRCRSPFMLPEESTTAATAFMTNSGFATAPAQTPSARSSVASSATAVTSPVHTCNNF